MLSEKVVLRFISYWPPFLAGGISVHQHDLEKGFIESKLTLRFYNTNYFGTHFGGNLFAMTDPFYAFLLSYKLGKNYYIWDRASTIEFIKAVKEPVFAKFQISPEQITDICNKAASGDKVEPTFLVEIRTKSGELVAKSEKTLYVKLKKDLESRHKAK